MILYDTVLERGAQEQVIRKSRFIASAAPCSDREEAERFIAEVSRDHRDATHNVPAYVLGDHFQLQWGSDDGEPQGTAGAPIVKMLVEEGITNVALVVTRYFGGVKLGTGGLVRAYTSSAKLCVAAAGRCHVEQKRVQTFSVDYGSWNRIQHFDFGGRAEVRSPRFTDVVTLELVSEEEEAEWGAGVLSGLTNGKARLTGQENILCKTPVLSSN